MTFSGAIVDVDGTLVRGSRSLSGATTGLQALVEADIEPLLFSNNPTRPGAYYRDRLHDCGLPVADYTAVTAATVTAEYLAEHHPDSAIYVLGEAGLADQLRHRDLTLVTTPAAADVVVGSIDRQLSYDDLVNGFRALQHAEWFFGTDPDAAIPTGEGLAPGSGAIIAALEAAADRSVDAMLGKPSAVALETALDHLAVPPEECLIVGDRLDTDIALGADTAMTTVLVLTGVTDRAAVETAPYRPDHIIDSIGDLPTVLAAD